MRRTPSRQLMRCPQVHRRDTSGHPTACGPCGQRIPRLTSPLTFNTVAPVWKTEQEAKEKRAGTLSDPLGMVLADVLTGIHGDARRKEERP